MNDLEKQQEELSGDAVSRRAFLTRAAIAGAGISALAMGASAQAAMMPKQPAAETGQSYKGMMMTPFAKTEAQYRKGVIGPAMLSLATSQIAVDKASGPAAREFANFELREAIGVTTILKEMGTPIPPMSAPARDILHKIKTTPRGMSFDATYITAQLANHEFLRDLAESYLHNSTSRTNMAEMHGRHLAILMLGAFKEHVVHCKNIKRSMMA